MTNKFESVEVNDHDPECLEEHHGELQGVQRRNMEVLPRKQERRRSKGTPKL